MPACPSCQQPLDPGNGFCQQCGQRVSPPAAEKSSPGSSLGRVLGIGCLGMVGLLVLIGLIWAWWPDSPETVVKKALLKASVYDYAGADAYLHGTTRQLLLSSLGGTELYWDYWNSTGTIIDLEFLDLPDIAPSKPLASRSGLEMYVVSFRCEILNSTDPEQDRKRRSAWPAYLLRWLNHFEIGYWTSGMGSIYLVKEAGQWRIAVDPQEIAKIQLQSLRMFQTGEPQLITTRPASPLRPAPDSNSPESGRLDLGSCLQRFDQPEDSEFCKVRDDLGRVGWVAIKDTREIGPGGVQDAALAIIRAYMDDPANIDKPCLEVEHTIDKLKQGPGFDRIGRIELEFYRLLAIHRTGGWLFENGQDPQNPETNAWLKKHERLIGTSYYAVHPNNFWRLEALLPRNQSLQEKIAFTAATLYFPRECETLPATFCVFWSELDQKGEYLRRHPTGARARQVLADLKKELGDCRPVSRADRLDFNQIMGTDPSERERRSQELNAWRGILGKVPTGQDRDAILVYVDSAERMLQEAINSQPPE